MSADGVSVVEPLYGWLGQGRVRRGPSPFRRPRPGSAAARGLEHEEAVVDAELQLQLARLGADSAWAAADGAFLPSLSDFLS